LFGTEWTAERVADRLVAAFRGMRGVPIYSPRKGVFAPHRPIDGLELIAAAQQALGRESPLCMYLLTWARSRADRKVAAFCHEAGRPRSTLYHRRRRALERIAAFLNEQRAPHSALTSPDCHGRKHRHSERAA